MRALFNKIYNYFNGINGILLFCYFAFTAISYFIVRSYQDGVNSSFCLYILLLLILSPVIIRFFGKLRIVNSIANKKNDLICNIFYCVVPFLIFLIRFLIYYPGGFSTDSISQYIQAISNQYNDWHPVLHTLIFFKLPLLLTNGWTGSIGLFQIIVLSAAVTYSVISIKKYTNNRYAIGSMVFIVINPLVGRVSLYPWKDVGFAIGALLLLSYLLNIYFTDGFWIKKPVNMIAFIVILTATTIIRHNAILFTLPVLFALFFLIAKKRFFIVCLGVIVLFFGIKVPLYSYLNVEKPGSRQTESLGLAMTVIGGVVANNPEYLDFEILDFAYAVAPKEVWEENYSTGNFNSVKWVEGCDTSVIDEYGYVKVLSMMLDCIKASPGCALYSLVKLVDKVYEIDEYYSSLNDILNVSVSENNYNISSNNISIFGIIDSDTETVISEDLMKWFSYLFTSLGLVHLILIISVLSKFNLKKFVDWKRIFIVLPLFCYNFGTSLLLSSYNDTVRFFYYTFLVVPILLVFIYSEKTKEAKDITV